MITCCAARNVPEAIGFEPTSQQKQVIRLHAADLPRCREEQ